MPEPTGAPTPGPAPAPTNTSVSDPTPTPPPMSTNPPYPQSTPETPAQQAPPVQAPAAPQYAPSTQDVDMGQVLTWAPDRSASLQDLAKAHEELTELKSQGLDSYTRGMGGDYGEARNYIDKLEEKTAMGTTPPPQGQQPVEPEPVMPPGWNETVQYVNYARQREIRDGVDKFLTQEPYRVLAQRPGIVDDILVRLNQVQTQLPQGESISPKTISNVVGEMAKSEQGYLQQRQDQWQKANAGTLGVDGDPFRGGTPLQPAGERPDKKNWPEYKKWIARKWTESRRADMAADEAASMGS